MINLNKKFGPDELSEFAEYLQAISEQIGFKVSSRGWAYQLETNRLINKGDFDKVTNLINKCRKLGYLPIDFVAEEDARSFKNVEKPNKKDIVGDVGTWLEHVQKAAELYTPNWWDGEEYYIQMVVEKIDLVTLFRPVCEEYHICIANSKGWSSMLQRAEYARRFSLAESKGLECVLLYCIPENELILKKGGFSPIQEINLNEKILGESGFVEAFNVYERSYKGYLYEFNSVNMLPFSVTPEHPIKTATVERYRHPKDGIHRKFISEDFTEAKDVDNRMYLKLSIPKFKIKQHSIKLKIKSKNHNKIPDKIKEKKGILPITKGIAKLLGYYLGDGCYSGCPNLSFNKKDTHLINQYKKIVIQEFGYKPSTDSTQTCTQLRFGGNLLGKWLIDNFGKYALTKKIPDFVFELPDDILSEFIRGYIEADGSENKVKTRISTASKGLALQFQMLILSRYKELVSLYHMKRAKKAIIQGREVNQHDKYEMHVAQQTLSKIFKHKYLKKKGRRKWFIEGEYVYTPITGIEKRYYEGKVYNFTTTDHTVSVNNIVTHNCGDHDPDGLRISEFIRKNLYDLKNITWDDGLKGYDPSGLIIDRFGLNYGFIEANGLTWIDNLITGSKRSLADPTHKNHHMSYVQEYLETIGERKCEANAIVAMPEEARDLVREAIEKYVGPDAKERFEEKRQAVRDEFDVFMDESGLGLSIDDALDQINNR